ncbi:MAG: TolC family protein [Bacteroidota bacterium]
MHRRVAIKVVPVAWLLAAATAALTGMAQETAMLDLPTAIAGALAADPGILTAQAGLAQSKAGVAMELAEIAPGCAVSAGYQQESGTTGSKSIAISFGQTKPGFLPRFFGSGTAGEVEQALWSQAEAENRLEQARIAAVVETVRKYLAAYQAGKTVALRRKALDLAGENERLARVSLAAGMATKMDVLRAESSRSRAELDLRAAEADRQIALAGLLNQIGRKEGGEVALAPPPAVPSTGELNPETLADEALRGRIEAISARYRLRRAENALAQARNASLPMLTLVATEHQDQATLSASLNLTTGDLSWSLGGQWQDPALPPAMQDKDGLSLGLNLNWNILDGGANKARRAAAQAELDSARVALAKTEETIKLEIRQKLSDLEMAGLRLAQARREAELAQQARDLAALRYREGVALFSELEEATQSLAQAELGVMQAEGNLFLAGILLDQACGRMPKIGS